MNKKLIFWLIGILVVSISAYYLFFNEESVSVREATTEEMIIRETILASGSFRSINLSDLSFAAAGRISNISVSKGDTVSQGQILASLNSYSVSQNAQAARDARDIALRDKDLFLERYQNDKDSIGGEEQYNIQLRIVNERISQAEANYQATLGNISNYYIRAPFSGTVLDIWMSIGEVASPGVPVIKIADMNDVYFEASIDQEDFGKIRLGTKALVEIDAYPNKIFQGEIKELPSYAGTELSSTQLRIKIIILNDHSNTETPILIGMRGEARLIVNETQSSVKAYLFDTIFYDENQNPFVWTLTSENKLTRIPVEIGVEGDIYTEILTDLNMHTVVVPSDPRADIEEGMTAKIL